jgi:ABC-2 type transport system ATP-binding protein
VRLSGLTKRFKRRLAVNQADLEVQPGDIFGLLGPNGAGKTTIIRMLLGLIAPTSGQVAVFGYDPMRQRAAVLARLAALVESPALYPGLSGRANLRAMALLSGVDDSTRIEQVLDQMSLAPHAGARFGTYSLGMKQRLCIAAALLTDPQLLILDEPTNGLDPEGMADIRRLIVEFVAQGRTVFLSSHLLHEVQQICNRVAVIQHGRIIVQGRVAELLAGQQAIRVRVAPDERERAGQALAGAGWSDRSRDTEPYLLVAEPPDAGAAINRALAGAGIFAGEITPHSQSLEEYYMSLVATPPGAQDD